MPLRFVLDENLRGSLLDAIERWNKRGAYVLDVLRVGESADLPLGISDPDLLVWAEMQDRIVITLDKRRCRNTWRII